MSDRKQIVIILFGIMSTAQDKSCALVPVKTELELNEKGVMMSKTEAIEFEDTAVGMLSY